MQLKLISIVLILHCIEYTECRQHASRHRQHKQSPGVSWGCHGGCLTCSDSNGCLSCKPRFFFFLERRGMRQVGVCLSSCPSGYYDVRSTDINKCTKCGLSDCETCFTRTFCTRCKDKYYLLNGKCQETCPEGFLPSDTQNECVLECIQDCDTCLNSNTCSRCKEGLYLLQGSCYSVCPPEFEPDDQLMECILKVHCEVGNWGDWGPCSRQGKTCGYKRGKETRIREVLKLPSPHGDPCPDFSETRKCVIKKKRCPGSRKGDRKQRNHRREKEIQESRGERREREKEIQESRGERREREKERAHHNHPENGNKTEQQHRWGQNNDGASTAEGDVE